MKTPSASYHYSNWLIEGSSSEGLRRSDSKSGTGDGEVTSHVGPLRNWNLFCFSPISLLLVSLVSRAARIGLEPSQSPCLEPQATAHSGSGAEPQELGASW